MFQKLFNWVKKTETALHLRKGYKIVAPPQSESQQRMLKARDITTSGGCRTAHIQHAH
jgi:hypothetical protein